MLNDSYWKPQIASEKSLMQDLSHNLFLRLIVFSQLHKSHLLYSLKVENWL